MTQQIYQKKDSRTTGNVIKDMTHWFDYLEHESKPLQDVIKSQMQRAQQGGPGAKYAQRDLEAITKAFGAYIEFRGAVVDYLNDLGDAYLSERARAKAYEKLSDRRFDLAFSGTIDLYRQAHGLPHRESLKAKLQNRVA